MSQEDVWFFNNLFPVKDASGQTVRLVAVSPGYVRAFDVATGVLPVAQ